LQTNYRLLNFYSTSPSLLDPRAPASPTLGRRQLLRKIGTNWSDEKDLRWR